MVNALGSRPRDSLFDSGAGLMPCDKCHGRFQECDDNELNEITFGDKIESFVVCDNCNDQAYDYLRDFF